MNTFYLPSSTTGYITQNANVQFRLIVTEEHDDSAQRIRVQVYAYRTDEYETDGQGSVSIYVDGFEKYSDSFSMGDYPINSSGVYLTDELITLSELHDSVEVTAKVSLPNTTAGTTTNGGMVIFTTKPTNTEYTVVFDSNGGIITQSSITSNVGTAVTIPSEKPFRTGYQFIKWVAKKDPNNLFVNNTWGVDVNKNYLKRVRISRLASVSPTRFEVLAYAENVSNVKFPTWTVAGAQDDIVYHNLGLGEWIRSGQTYNYGTQIEMLNHVKYNDYKDLIDIVTHMYCYDSDGNVLDTYCSYDTCYDIEFYPGDKYEYNFGVTLYAQWEPNTLNVFYNANGADMSSELYYLNNSDNIYQRFNSSPYSQKWIYNNANSGGLINAEEFGIYRTGYKFVGWNKQPDGNGDMFDENDESLIPRWITENIDNITNCSLTLYAIWESMNVAYYKIDGSYKLCNTYIKDGNQWKPAIVYQKIDGNYKKSIINE